MTQNQNLVKCNMHIKKSNGLFKEVRPPTFIVQVDKRPDVPAFQEAVSRVAVHGGVEAYILDGKGWHMFSSSWKATRKLTESGFLALVNRRWRGMSIVLGKFIIIFSLRFGGRDKKENRKKAEIWVLKSFRDRAVIKMEEKIGKNNSSNSCKISIQSISREAAGEYFRKTDD